MYVRVRTLCAGHLPTELHVVRAALLQVIIAVCLRFAAVTECCDVVGSGA